MSDKIVTLTDTELEQLLRKASKEAVYEAFLMLGVDIKDPIATQADFHFLRDTRQASESIKEKGLLVIVSTVIAGILAACWVGFRSMLTPPLP